MAIVATDWTVDRATKVVAYVGDDHTGVNPSYATVIEYHRWLQELADDAVAIPASGDELDITNVDPSKRSTDNIITHINGYTLNAAAPEHLYDGSIIQGVVGVDQIIWDGVINFGNPEVQIQIHQDGAVLVDDWWNAGLGGSHTGTSNPTIMTDSSLSTALTNRSIGAGDLVGYILYNITDGSQGVITANTTGTITVDDLVGGTGDTFETADVYKVGIPLNYDTTAGISHKFMVQVHDFAGAPGGDIDGRRLIGTARRFNYTFQEFKINGSTRGNNVLALADAGDLNNITSLTTVAGWTGITLVTEGYVGLDVNDDATPEYYFSEWNTNYPTRSINNFYERMKYLSRDGSTETLYGLNGELFRGITHEIAISTPTGTFSAFEGVSWAGATPGTGQMLAIDSTTAGTTMWIQLLTGLAPSGGATITGVSTATAVQGTVTDRSALVSKPFIGASTGTQIIGAYGIGIQPTDINSGDKLFDLTNTQYSPPNLVTNSVTGIVISEDYVLVAPAFGVDGNGDPAIDKNQFEVGVLLNADNITEVTIQAGRIEGASIPVDTPSTGYIRVTDNDGFERRLHYSSWTGSAFTIDTTDGNEDFASVNASIGNNVYIAYLDQLATATSHSYQATYASDRSLVVVVRDGKTTPIKQFISAFTFASSNASIAVIRTTDE